MPKLRNAETDLGKFTQWVARKCRNHNPLKELSMSDGERAKMPNIYRDKGTTRPAVSVIGEDQDTVLYRAGERSFKINIAEIESHEEEALLESLPVVTVGR